MNKNVLEISKNTASNSPIPNFNSENTNGNLVFCSEGTVLGISCPALYYFFGGPISTCRELKNLNPSIYLTKLKLTTYSPKVIKGVIFTNYSDGSFSPTWINIKNNGRLILSITGRSKAASLITTYLLPAPTIISNVEFEFEATRYTGDGYNYTDLGGSIKFIY
jgi:hypothetical protein